MLEGVRHDESEPPQQVDAQFDGSTVVLPAFWLRRGHLRAKSGKGRRKATQPCNFREWMAALNSLKLLLNIGRFHQPSRVQMC